MVYEALNQYDREAIVMTTFEPEQYAEDLQRRQIGDLTLQQVQLYFFSRLNESNLQEPVYQPPLTEQVTVLKTENESLKSKVSDVEMTLTEILFS